MLCSGRSLLLEALFSLRIRTDYHFPANSKQFGKPIASFQLIQKKLADASMEASRESFLSPLD